MDLTSKVNRLLAEFAGRIGLPSLSLDEEGMASLLFDEQVGVTLLLLAERERLLLEADVAGIDVLGEGIDRRCKARSARPRRAGAAAMTRWSHPARRPTGRP